MDITNKIKKELNDYFKVLEYIDHTCNVETNSLDINVKIFDEKCTCPKCKEISQSKYSKTIRKVVDMPIDNYFTTYIIHTHYYVCRNKDCCNNNYFTNTYHFVESKESKSKRLIDYIVKTYKENSVRKAADILDKNGIKMKKTSLQKLKDRLEKGIHQI